MLKKISSILAGFLTKEVDEELPKTVYYQVSLDEIKPVLKPCDVILIESQRIIVIFLTFFDRLNSLFYFLWSHFGWVSA